MFSYIAPVQKWQYILPGTATMVSGLNATVCMLCAGMFHGLSNQRICIANAIALAIKKEWRLVLPDLRFNYPDLSTFFTVPFNFLFDVSSLDKLQHLG